MTKGNSTNQSDIIAEALSIKERAVPQTSRTKMTLVGGAIVGGIALGMEGVNVAQAVNNVLPPSSGTDLSLLRAGLFGTLSSVAVTIHYIGIRARDAFGEWVDTGILAAGSIGSLILVGEMMGLSSASFQGELMALQDEVAAAETYGEQLAALSDVLFVLWPVAISVAHLAMVRVKDAKSSLDDARFLKEDYEGFRDEVAAIKDGRSFVEIRRQELAAKRAELDKRIAGRASTIIHEWAAKLHGYAVSPDGTKLPDGLKEVGKTKLGEQSKKYSQYSLKRCLDIIKRWRAA